MKGILYSIVVAFAFIAFLALCDADHYESRNEQLKDSIRVRDSIIFRQHVTILQLTYQHEDDDAFMEEELP